MFPDVFIEGVLGVGNVSLDVDSGTWLVFLYLFMVGNSGEIIRQAGVMSQFT